MFYLPYLKKLLELLGFKRIATWMIRFGHRIPKPTVLWSNLPNINNMKRTFHWCSCDSVFGLHIACMFLLFLNCESKKCKEFGHYRGMKRCRKLGSVLERRRSAFAIWTASNLQKQQIGGRSLLPFIPYFRYFNTNDFNNICFIGTYLHTCVYLRLYFASEGGKVHWQGLPPQDWAPWAIQQCFSFQTLSHSRPNRIV